MRGGDISKMTMKHTTPTWDDPPPCPLETVQNTQRKFKKRTETQPADKCFAFLSKDNYIDALFYFYERQNNIVTHSMLNTDLGVMYHISTHYINHLIKNLIIEKKFSEITGQMLGYGITCTGILYAQIYTRMLLDLGNLTNNE